jgi:hypothetical protein
VTQEEEGMNLSRKKSSIERTLKTRGVGCRVDEWRQGSSVENGFHVHIQFEAFQVGVEKRYVGCVGAFFQASY